ncbi:kat8 regulatory nsl complex subunit 3 [Phtheirospermum japonicum]|uniref:Kat8 regulatory nsl complex subunit 3 n=1 Tax=Phtheirospermum japonicum TaxID=374723 RepID=A0A830BQB4_9LAMI|nr:kat8 regulatory nsl complex subunit 3 [Phtheirospermum japonicum]
MVIKRVSKRRRKDQNVQDNVEENRPSPPGVDETSEQLREKSTNGKQKEKPPVVVLAHGAGAPSSSDWMIRWKCMLAEALNAIEVVTFDYPCEIVNKLCFFITFFDFMDFSTELLADITGKKRWVPPKAEKLIDFHSEIVKKTMDKYPGHPLILAGKSMGSRVSCMVAGDKDIAASAVVCLGYPLKGTKGAIRDETLLQLTVPVMFVQGSKDGLCSLEQLEDVRKKMNVVTALHVIEGGDHCFKIAKRDLLSSGSSQEEAEDQAVRAISEFVSSSLGVSPVRRQQPALPPPPTAPPAARSLWHMATTPRSHSPHSSRSTSPPQTTSKKRTRQATRCIWITKHCVGGKKLPLDIDEVTGKIKRAHQVKLSSYLGKLARGNVSILYSKWSDVPDDDKEMIWQEVLAVFEISNAEQMKKKILQSVGIKWSHFKTQLTTFWIYGEYKHLSPCEQYNIPQNEWDEFKKIRLDPAWQETRKKAQETQKKNTTPHTLSRGGYDLLDERIMADKLKKRLEEAAESDTDVEPPSPPKRHEKFKLARIRKSGEMTDAAREIAKRIDELEKQAAEGSFVPEGRQDILATAIGRPEHPGRVRGVGVGIGARGYFGPLPRGSSMNPEFLERLTQKITLEVTQNLMKQFGPSLVSLGAQSQQTPVKEHTPHVAPVSRNGSCVAPIDDPTGEETHNGVSDRCGLYIDERPPRLVAFGRVHEGGLTLHGVPLSGDLVRVSVEDVRDGLAPVPRRTAEVSLVGQALGGFVAWPRHLIKPIAAEDIERPKKRVRPVDRSSEPPLNNLILELLNTASSLYNNPLRVAWDTSAFGVENDTPLYIHHNEVLEVVQGNVGLSMSVIQLWVMFLNSLSVGTGNDDLYGFFEPYCIQNMGDQRQEATAYIRKHVLDSKKPIYLGAYHQEKNWQLLLLLPKEGVAVWFCSQHRKPDPYIKVIVQGLMTQFKVLNKHSSKSKQAVHWIYPKNNKQDESWESGYYVMHWMWTIVRVGIKDNWPEVFCDDKALPSESIEKIRTQWARYFLEGVKGAVRDETLLKLTVPVMFVQGSKDGLCPLEQLEAVRKKMNAISGLHVIEGGDHSFKIAKKHLQCIRSNQEEVEGQAVRAITGFVSSNLYRLN